MINYVPKRDGTLCSRLALVRWDTLVDPLPTYENQNFKYLHWIWRRYLCGRSKGTHLEIKILLRFNLGLKILVWPFEGDAFGFEDTHETEMGVEDTH